MTNPAQISDDTTRKPPATDDLLVLPSQGGAIPRTVYVKAVNVGGVMNAGFALDASSKVWPTGGVSWEFAADDVQYGLFINFVLVAGIDDLALPNLLPPGYPVFWFSEAWAPAAGQPQSQLSCSPLVAGFTTTYHFRANFTGGGSIDPKIIVTPLPGDGGPGA